jgi:predicted RNase H-like nuclease
VICGADGYRGGWIAAVDLGNGKSAVEEFGSFKDLLDHCEFDLIAIDVPIGLFDAGARQCDLWARRMLGIPRSASVFPAPIRPMLQARTYGEACSLRFELEGKRCSKQLFNILGKVKEVDAAMAPHLQERVLEAHPEVSFAALSGSRPMQHPKTTKRGRLERLALLRKHFTDVADRMVEKEGIRASTDIIDAYACLWTARRIGAGREKRLPPGFTEVDPRGLRAEIAY